MKVKVRLANSNQIATVYTVADIDEFKKGSVISFNGRDGVVVPTAGDYTATQVTGAFDYVHDTTDRITEGDAKKFVTTSEKNAWDNKQDQLISGTNIKTINGSPVLGSGDLTVSGAAWGDITGTLLSQTDLSTALSGKEPAITASLVTSFLSGTKTFRDLATDVRAVNLTGLSRTSNSAISETDTILSAFGKLQSQITGTIVPSTYLYNVGDEATALTGGWVNGGTYSAVMVRSKQAASLQWAMPNGSVDRSDVVTNNQIDLTTYSKIKITYSVTTTTGTGSMNIRVTDNKGSTFDTAGSNIGYTAANFSASGSGLTLILDISAITNSHYVALEVLCNGSIGFTINVSKVELLV